jgi:hypothetical protein
VLHPTAVLIPGDHWPGRRGGQDLSTGEKSASAGNQTTILRSSFLQPNDYTD